MTVWTPRWQSHFWSGDEKCWNPAQQTEAPTKTEPKFGSNFGPKHEPKTEAIFEPNSRPKRDPKKGRVVNVLRGEFCFHFSVLFCMSSVSNLVRKCIQNGFSALPKNATGNTLQPGRQNIYNPAVFWSKFRHFFGSNFDSIFDSNFGPKLEPKMDPIFDSNLRSLFAVASDHPRMTPNQEHGPTLLGVHTVICIFSVDYIVKNRAHRFFFVL